MFKFYYWARKTITNHPAGGISVTISIIAERKASRLDDVAEFNLLGELAREMRERNQQAGKQGVTPEHLPSRAALGGGDPPLRSATPAAYLAHGRETTHSSFARAKSNCIFRRMPHHKQAND